MLNSVFDTNLKGSIIYIRHAQTSYNIYTEEIKQLKQIRLEEKYLDCELCEVGKNQAEILSQKIINLDIKYCFTSPLLRCLETSLIALKNHKNAKNIEIIIHPLLNEIISSTQTLTKPIKIKKAQFNFQSEVKYNWSIFDRYFEGENDQNHFYFNFIDHRIVESQKELVLQIKNNEKEGLISQFLGSFWKNGCRPETFNSLLHRTLLFKNFLKEFIIEKKIPENEKILIFTHAGFIRMSSSNIVSLLDNLTDFPTDGFVPGNCECISIKNE